jgi:hypothetical protein
MRAPFWRDSYRYSQPAWKGGLRDSDLADWTATGKSASALAAIQWRVVLERAREEAKSLPPNRYMEIRYEGFVSEPHVTLDTLFMFGELLYADAPHAFVDQRLRVRDLTASWRDRLDEVDIETIETMTSKAMKELGYSPETAV